MTLIEQLALTGIYLGIFNVIILFIFFPYVFFKTKQVRKTIDKKFKDE